MPAETHQRGRLAGCEEILEFLSVLLGDGSGLTPNASTLLALGVDDDAALWDLWDAVREEFGERTLGTVESAEVLDATMTVERAAFVMASLLAGSSDEDSMLAGREVNGR